MIATAELAVQRRLTKAFIDADRITVILMRSLREDDGAGSITVHPPEPLAPQRMRLIPKNDGTSSASTRTTADGQMVQPSYALLAPYNADMERFDEFVLAGDRYQVVFINQNRQYEVKGEVAYLGGV